MGKAVSSIPTGGNYFFLLFKTLDVNFVQKCQICVENEKPACSCDLSFFLQEMLLCDFTIT